MPWSFESTWRRTVATWALLALAATTLRAQSVVVPAVRANTDGSSGGALAGVEQRFRMLVLLDGAALQAANGHGLTALAFRRDGQHPGAQQGGRVALSLSLSTSDRAVGDAAPVFADNHGADRRLVFAGEVAVPNAPPLASRDGATWNAPDAIAIALPSPFAYAGGTLCLDLLGTPVTGATSPWWRIDHELYGHDAGIVVRGSACDPTSQAFASRNTLLPGGSLDVVCSGPRNATGVLLLGTTPLEPMLDLGFLGAPGCLAGVAPALTLPAPVDGGPMGSNAAANLTVQLPSAPWLAGGRLHAQWIVFPNPRNAALFTTTSALQLDVASAPSTLPGVLVRTGPLAPSAPWPTAGRVYPQLMPVVRVTYR